MKILKYPNELLTTPCEPVTTFDEALKTFIEEMKETMTQANGLGLSANQVSVSKQIFIVKDTKGAIHEFINPTIVETEGSTLMTEGCLSAVGIHLPITRPATVLVEYQDITGEKRRLLAEGIDARAIQHEMEHLQGEFYFSKVNRQMRKIAISKLRKMK